MSAAQTGVKVLSPLASALFPLTFGASCIAGWEIGKKLGRGRLWGKKHFVRVHTSPSGEIIVEGFSSKEEAGAFAQKLMEDVVIAASPLSAEESS